MRKLLKKATDLAGEPISDNKFINLFNDCLHDLAMLYDTAKLRDIQVIVCKDPMEGYDLTDGCLKIERTLTSHGNYFSMYKVRSGKIYFAVRDTYTLSVLLGQEKAEGMDYDIEIDRAFYKAMAEYIAGKAVMKTQPELSKALLQESAADAELANRSLRRTGNPNRRVYAPRFR